MPLKRAYIACVFLRTHSARIIIFTVQPLYGCIIMVRDRYVRHSFTTAVPPAVYRVGATTMTDGRAGNAAASASSRGGGGDREESKMLL